MFRPPREKSEKVFLHGCIDSGDSAWQNVLIESRVRVGGSSAEGVEVRPVLKA